MIRGLFVLAALVLLPLVPARAATCDTVGVYGVITLVVCPGAKDDATLKEAGVAACEPVQKRGVCNAWIWSRDDRAARTLPMSKSQLESVTALWIHKQETLKVCSRDGCYAGQKK